MNREDIIRMAQEAGLIYWTHNRWWMDAGEFGEEIERFAAFVAAAEREACAKVCENGIANATDWDSIYWDQACENRAAAIRAKGQE